MQGDDDDIEVGLAAVFTFGKSKFAGNDPGKFWMKNDNVRSVACGDEHTIIATESGKLYTFGSNDWGQLGLENCNETSVTKPTTVTGYLKPDFELHLPLSLLLALKHEKVKGVAGGRCHTVIATESGKVYTCGCNSEGQLGLGDNRGRSEPCHMATITDTVKMVAAGSHHSAVLTDAGCLFVFGSNAEGQLGLGEVTGSHTPKEIKMDRPIVYVACGYYHTAVVTDDGNLYTFGENEDKLGLQLSERSNGTNRPQYVSGMKEKVTLVACGGNHTAALTEVGTLYTFGCGVRGQLGQGNMILESALPGLVKALSSKKVVQVSCGESHTAAVTEDGVLYTFGDGRHGKLGHGNDHSSNQFVPCSVTRFTYFTVQQVACGGCHTVIVAKKIETPQESYSGDEMETEIVTSLGNSPVWPVQHNNLARSRRRQKDHQVAPNLPKILPPLNKMPRSVEELNKSESSTQDVHNSLQVEKLEERLKAIDAIDEQEEDDTASVTSEISQFNKTHEMTILEHNRSLLLPVKSKSFGQSDIQVKSKDENVTKSSSNSEESVDMHTEDTTKGADSPNPSAENTTTANNKGKSFLSRIFSFNKSKSDSSTEQSKKIKENSTKSTTDCIETVESSEESAKVKNEPKKLSNEIAGQRSPDMGSTSRMSQCSRSKACILL